MEHPKIRFVTLLVAAAYLLIDAVRQASEGLLFYGAEDWAGLVGAVISVLVRASLAWALIELARNDD